MHTLLVTGVDRPIGRAVARQALRRGAKVVGVELGEAVGRVERDGLTVFRGPAADGGLWRRATEGVTHVVHALIDVRPTATYEELAPINLDLSSRLYAASREAGVAAVVLLSEARLYAPADRYVSEDAEIRPTDPAGQSLYDAEILLRGLANRHPDAPKLVVLRRTRLYGHLEPPPEAPWWALPPILGLYFELIPGLAGGPRSQWLHLDDLARAAVHVAELEGLDAITTFNVADDTPLTVGEVFNAVIEAYGFPVGIKVPYPSPAVLRRALSVADRPVLRATADVVLARLWRAAAGPAAGAVTPRLGEAVVWGLTDDLLVDNDALKATGFELAHPDSREGLPGVIARYQREGFVPSERRGEAQAESPETTLGTAFAETMRGVFRFGGVSGAAHPIAFDVRLSTPGVQLPLTDRIWNLDGRLRAEGLAADVPIHGTLEIAPYGKRRLVYEFGFVGDDGHNYRFEGVKRIRWLDMRRSLTELTLRILDAKGGELATGEMSFDLRRDLVDFVRSFRLTRVFESGPATD